MTTAPLPRLRRKRRFDVPRLVGRFSDGVAAVEAQVGRYHERWDEQNHEALASDGPLWVVLGDSASQGVGASRWELGWVNVVRDRLDSASGQRWRIVNLSMSGGRFADVTNSQVPVLNDLLPAPDLITCVIGSNDLIWRRGTNGVVSDARRTVSVLPSGTFVSRLNGPGPRPSLLNEVFEKGRSERDHRLFSIWDWPSGRGALAADRIHPSDLGYAYMADLAWARLAEWLALRY